MSRVSIFALLFISLAVFSAGCSDSAIPVAESGQQESDGIEISSDPNPAAADGTEQDDSSAPGDLAQPDDLAQGAETADDDEAGAGAGNGDAQEPDPLAEIGENAGRMMTFYLEPSEENFRLINASLTKHQEQIDADGANSGFPDLAATFLARANEKHGYEIQGSGTFFDLARKIVSRDGGDEKAAFINDDSAITPGKLDVWWVSFFTTGETRYLELLLDQTGEPVDENLNEADLIVRSANWSFESNCRNNDVVRAFAASALEMDKWESKREFLEGCLADE